MDIANEPTNNSEFPEYQYLVEEESLGMRLDVFVAQKVDGLSRSKAIELVRGGFVLLNGKKPKASLRLKTGDVIDATIAKLKPELPIAEEITLDILYEDEALVAVNKPAGMVVHPAKGHWQGTLTAALMHHINSLSTIGGAQRPGIVHRLDRDTSGVILVAKTDPAHQALAGQFENRTVKKQYLAIVTPPPDRDRDEIDQPIGVHPYQREKMAIRADHKTSRTAQTFYETKSRSGRFSMVDVFPKTGRTHQIRVHLAHIGSPVLCDKLYSGRSSIVRGELIEMDPPNSELASEVVLARQALHATQIEFKHPLNQKPMTITAPLAKDIKDVMELVFPTN